MQRVIDDFDEVSIEMTSEEVRVNRFVFTINGEVFVDDGIGYAIPVTVTN